MQDRLLDFARWVFRRLPLDRRTKTEWAFRFFALTGERFRHIPAYRVWQRERAWLKMKIPEDIDTANAGVLAAYAGASPAPAILMVNHALGGGTGRHVDDLRRRLAEVGIASFLLENHNGEYVRILLEKGDDTGLLFFDPRRHQTALRDALQALNIRHIHLHHTMDMPEGFLGHFARIAAESGLRYDYTAHDYFSICPRFTLFDEAVRGYCGEPSDVRKCDACVHRHGSAAGSDVDVAAWRGEYAALLNGARRVFVPSQDVETRLRRYMPDAPFALKPHAESAAGIRPSAATRNAGEPLRIVLVGGLAPHKGSGVLLRCAEDAQQRRLPLEFTLLGFSDIDHRLRRLPNVTVSGRFDPEALPQMLADGGYHLAFLPSVIPETYNYALSECWRGGLYTACFDIGAIAERVRATGFGAVLPLEWYFRPEKINGFLLALDIPHTVPEAAIRESFARYDDILADYYELELNEAARLRAAATS